MADLDRALARIAEEQRQLITLSDVVECGGTRSDVHRRVRGGRLGEIDRGVYLFAGAPRDWGTRLLANILSAGAGSGARASHSAAARLWRFEGFATASREISIHRGRTFRRPSLRTHESTDLQRSDLRRREGIPVTDPARTLLDLARYLPDQRLLRAIESARRLGVVDWSMLIRTLSRHARRGRPGIRRLRRVIVANAHRDEITDSDFELLVIALLLEQGLPEPVLHHKLFQDGRCVAEIDLAYPALKIAIELDGKDHDTPEAAAEHAAKQNYLVLAGWTILRYRYSQYCTTPGTIVRQVRAAFAT